MRVLRFSGIAAAAAIFGFTAPTPAIARDYPFCIGGEGYESPLGDCRFDSYQQCQAAASGRLNYCQANPYYSSAKTRDIARPRKPGRPY